MCGVFGAIGIPIGEADVDTVFGLLKNRGPDAQGYSFEKRDCVLVGHTRLSIHDLSPLGDQPMHSSGGRYVVGFNGEIYNHEILRSDLIKVGYVFRGTSDTEVMLACFEEYGVEGAIEKFVGMYAFSLHDKEARKVYLVRDRMGEKPLFYHIAERSLAWASGVNVFQHFRTLTCSVSRAALAKLLRYNYIPSPSSIYNEVFKLPPGSLMIIDLEKGLSSKTIKTYWSIQDQVSKKPLRFDSDREAVDELERLLKNSLIGQMQSDVPLGAFLSGGVDSSLIVAMMQKLSPKKVKTFSMGFEVEGYNEAPFARDVASYLKTDHTEHIISAQDALEVVPSLAHIYDEPFADSSAIPTFLVSKLAKQKLTVALSGDGGDELFHGYSRYQLCEIRHKQFNKKGFFLVGKGLANLPLNIRNLFANLSEGNLTSRQLKVVGEYMKYSQKSDFYQSSISHNLDAESYVLNTLSADSKSVLFNEFDKEFPRDYALTDMITYLPDDILAKVDRASMAVSLETRVPFLDRKIVEFSLRLPLSYKIRSGCGKWILKELLDREIPRHLIDRPKRGFSVPLAEWLRKDLRDWAEGLLEERALRDNNLFNYKYVAALWSQHLKGADLSAQLWPILMANQWIECNA